MSESIPEVPAVDNEENPDLLAGDLVEDPYDIDISKFAILADEEVEDA